MVGEMVCAADIKDIKKSAGLLNSFADEVDCMKCPAPDDTKTFNPSLTSVIHKAGNLLYYLWLVSAKDQLETAGLYQKILSMY